MATDMGRSEPSEELGAEEQTAQPSMAEAWGKFGLEGKRSSLDRQVSEEMEAGEVFLFWFLL